MAVTPNEILALFSQASAVANSDQFLLHGAEGVGGNNAVKVTAEKVKAYLLTGVVVTIGEDGYWYIGGTSTGVKAEGVTPLFERRSDGFYVSTDGGETYQVLAYFTDFNDKVVNHTNTTVSIKPNVLNVWGAVNSLNISFTAGNSGDENEYKLQFKVNSNSFTLTLPNGVKWIEEPEWESGYTYQVSVLNGLALGAGWEGNAL